MSDFSYTHNQHLIQYFRYEIENRILPNQVGLIDEGKDASELQHVRNYMQSRIDEMELQCKRQVKTMRGKSDKN